MSHEVEVHESDNGTFWWSCPTCEWGCGAIDNRGLAVNLHAKIADDIATGKIRTDPSYVEFTV